jgi:hypothetical protein
MTTDTDTRYAAALATLASTPALLRSLVAPLPAALAEEAEGDSWSPKDVVGHLILAERHGAIARIRAIVMADDPLLPDRDEDDELAASGLRAAPLGGLLAKFATVREQDVTWLRSLDAPAWLRAGRHSAVGRVTAGEFLCHAAYHDCLHVAQIASLLQARFGPHRGAMRAF